MKSSFISLFAGSLLVCVTASHASDPASENSQVAAASTSLSATSTSLNSPSVDAPKSESTSVKGVAVRFKQAKIEKVEPLNPQPLDKDAVLQELGLLLAEHTQGSE